MNFISIWKWFTSLFCSKETKKPAIIIDNSNDSFEQENHAPTIEDIELANYPEELPVFEKPEQIPNNEVEKSISTKKRRVLDFELSNFDTGKIYCSGKELRSILSKKGNQFGFSYKSLYRFSNKENFPNKRFKEKYRVCLK
jgi:hypothetical protein